MSGESTGGRMAIDMSETVRTVKVCDGKGGFYLCNADAVPKGAKLFEQSDDDKSGSGGQPNEGTIAWFEMKLDEAGVDRAGITKRNDLKALYEEKVQVKQ